MSWSTGYGFNFRSTVGYVTDGSDEFFWRGGTQDSGIWTYPSEIVSGVTAGWVDDLGTGIDEDNTRDRRLAGRVARSNGAAGEAFFRIDLPAPGTYEIGLGFTSSVTATRIEVFDDATSEFVRSPTVSSGNVADAVGTVHTFADWPANQVRATVEFASTVCRVQVGGGGGSNSTELHHVFVRQVGSSGPGFRSYYLNQ
jgi:hypothetical protein